MTLTSHSLLLGTAARAVDDVRGGDAVGAGAVDDVDDVRGDNAAELEVCETSCGDEITIAPAAAAAVAGTSKGCGAEITTAGVVASALAALVLLLLCVVAHASHSLVDVPSFNTRRFCARAPHWSQA
jgi:hypothetical protein